MYENEDIDVIIEKIYKSTHCKIVHIIDEWDLVFRDEKKDKESKIEYLNFLTLLIKDYHNIILTYMTVILPIKSYGLNSGLRGIFDEPSIVSDNNLTKYIGFTEDDIKELCKNYLNNEILDCSYETQISISKNIYDEKIR